MANYILTNNVIEESLRNDLGQSTKLISFEFEICEPEGYNFFNATQRIKVIYLKDGKEGKTCYVAKHNPRRPADAYNYYRRRAIMKEVFFYKDLLPVLNVELEKMGDVCLRVPKYFYSSLEEGKEVLIIEDLSLRGFEIVPKTVHELDDAYTILMAKEISRLHAASDSLQKTLQVDDLCKIYSLLVESWHMNEPRYDVPFQSTFRRGMIRNITLTKALGKFEELLPWMERMRNKEMKAVSDELISTPPWKHICHGDYHRGNVMFRYNESNVPVEAMIIDWQTFRVSSPGTDIDYLMLSSYFGQSREAAFDIFTKSYFETYCVLRQSSNTFTLKELQNEAKNCNFGLLLWFFLLPLILSEDDMLEVFKVEESEKQVHDRLTSEQARELLACNHQLAFVIEDYLKEIYASSIWKN